MGDQCPLCDRRRSQSSAFCEFHAVALKNLEDTYANWKNGYGEGFSKELYFTKLEALGETGQAVKDVIRCLRKKGVQQ